MCSVKAFTYYIIAHAQDIDFYRMPVSMATAWSCVTAKEGKVYRIVQLMK